MGNKEILQDMSEAQYEIGRLYTIFQNQRGFDFRSLPNRNGGVRYTAGDCRAMGLSAAVIRLLKIGGGW